MSPEIIHEFNEYLTAKGYAPHTIHSYRRALEEVPDTWDSENPRELFEHINRCLQTERDSFAPANKHNLKPASSLFFVMRTGFTYGNFARQFALEGSIYADILAEFYTYSVEFKHLSKMSAESEKQHVLKFLNRLNCTLEELSEISAQDIRDYVCSDFKGLKTSSMGRYVTSLRNFFRFLEFKGMPVDESVLTLPLAPADWGKSRVPITLSPDEELRLRHHYVAEDGNGIRNKIIIQLMLDLGLRCAEVSDLRIDDVRWSNGTICVCRTKNKEERELPFSREIGRLLENYVLNHRPRIADRHLFLRDTIGGNYSSMTRECVRGVVRRALEKEEIQGWWKGTHALRRTAASKIYNAGNGLKLSADLLGHESLDSTKAYVRVDFQLLKEVAAPWPGREC